MIRKVKNWLGIESVKVKMDLPATVDHGQQKLKGVIELTSMSPQEVEYIEINFIEKYERGRKEDRRINDYQIGQWTIDDEIRLEPGKLVSLPFKMKLNWIESEMDAWQNKNAIAKRLVKLAKWSRKVKSTYRIEAELKVKGAKLHPFFKEDIEVIN